MSAPVLAFAVAGRPPSPNATRRQHWGSRSSDAKTLREAAYLVALDALRRSGSADDYPLRRAELEIVFVLVPTKNGHVSGDLDNLLAGSKPILDGISRGLGRKGERGPVLYDDGVETLVSMRVRWRPGRTEGVELYVREVASDGSN